MQNDENKTIQQIKLFEDSKIRSVWDEKEEQWYFSVVDVVAVLTESVNPRDYWFKMKKRVHSEDGIELSTICRQLKMQSADGKFYNTDAANVKALLRIIQSIPSPKAEPFKQWLAQVGYERILEIENPELAQERMKELYEKRQKEYEKQQKEAEARAAARDKAREEEMRKARAELEKERARAQRENDRQAEIERHRRRLYPEYYRIPEEATVTEPPSLQQQRVPAAPQTPPPAAVPQRVAAPLPAASRPNETRQQAVETKKATSLSDIKPVTYFNVDDDDAVPFLLETPQKQHQK